MNLTCLWSNKEGVLILLYLTYISTKGEVFNKASLQLLFAIDKILEYVFILLQFMF